MPSRSPSSRSARWKTWCDEEALGAPLVDDGPADGGVDHQLPHTQHAGGGGAERPEGSRHQHAAVLVDPQRVPGRDHAAAALRLRDGHRRAEARLRHLRDRLVVHQHGARPGGQLAGALRPSRAARIRGRVGESGGHQSDLRMVPRHRARSRRRCLQHGRVARFDARRAARGVGHPGPQLAVRVRAHRCDRARLGGAVAGVLPIARHAQGALGSRTGLHPVRAGDAPGRSGPAVDPDTSSASATSGASRSPGSSPIRPGAR